MKISDHSLLGPAPCWRGLLKWFLCIPVAAGSWHLYKLYPVGGLVAVGLTPFACLFLFFHGFGQISRTIPYLRTILRARRMHMTPVWGSASGGFLLVDPDAGLWASDRAGGTMSVITRLNLNTDGEAHRLEIFTDKAPEPTAVIGMGSPELLEAVSRRLQKDIAAVSGRAVLLTREEDEEKNRTP